jgi:hypothetical protein
VLENAIADVRTEIEQPANLNEAPRYRPRLAAT